MIYHAHHALYKIREIYQIIKYYHNVQLDN